MKSPPSSSSKPAIDNPQDAVPPARVPVGTYCVIYFIQASIMAMILTNVPVFLKQGLGLDWFALTASYAVMFVPVLLRPLFAWGSDRRPALIPILLVAGVLLVILGSACASLGALAGIGGIVITTVGFALAVVGATLMNVVADSHIVRVVPLDRSARVNSFKRTASFLGIGLGQICYLFLVGFNYTAFSRWMWYFMLPAIVAVGGFAAIIAVKKGWKVLPSVQGLPPRRAPWLREKENEARGNQVTPNRRFLILGVVVAIAFLFNMPEGLIESTFENFIVEIYGDAAWISYSTVLLLGGPVSILGFLLAGWGGKHAPERDLLWYCPLVIAYYSFLIMAPAFSSLLWVTVCAHLPTALIFVRLLQSWQWHSYTKHPALTFQVFMATYQFGKLAGIGLSGYIMATAGYGGIFTWAAILFAVALGLAIAHACISKR